MAVIWAVYQSNIHHSCNRTYFLPTHVVQAREGAADVLDAFHGLALLRGGAGHRPHMPRAARDQVLDEGRAGEARAAYDEETVPARRNQTRIVRSELRALFGQVRFRFGALLWTWSANGLDPMTHP